MATENETLNDDNVVQKQGNNTTVVPCIICVKMERSRYPKKNEEKENLIQSL